MQDGTHRPLVELKNASYRAGGREILADITWSLEEGENWVVRGGDGAGKTTFLMLVRGDIWPAPGIGSRIYYSNGKGRTSPIGFREKTGLVSAELLDGYKERRWNLSGLDTVCSGFFGSAFLNQRPSDEQLARAWKVIAALGIEDLADQSILTMSLGQAKKTLFARALVHEPRLLVLDEAFDAIDAASRPRILEVLDKLTQAGTRLLMATHAQEDLVPAMNRFLLLESGTIAEQGVIEKRISPAKAPNPAARFGPPPKQPKEKPALTAESDFVVRIEDTDVSIKGKHILSRINWTIKPGENWALLGPNGSGKTTLLKLIAGDLHPMPGGRIQRFGDSAARSLWEIRRRVSLVSSDLQAEHRLDQTGMETVLSGFFGSIGLYSSPSQEQEQSVRSMMKSFGLEELAHRSIRTLSYGHLRMLLILRAMTTQPELLLLDEPTSGLDERAEQDILNLVEQLAASTTAIVHVTHRADKLGESFNKLVFMDRGKLRLSDALQADQ